MGNEKEHLPPRPAWMEAILVPANKTSQALRDFAGRIRNIQTASIDGDGTMVIHAPNTRLGAGTPFCQSIKGVEHIIRELPQASQNTQGLCVWLNPDFMEHYKPADIQNLCACLKEQLGFETLSYKLYVPVSGEKCKAIIFTSNAEEQLKLTSIFPDHESLFQFLNQLPVTQFRSP